MKRQLPAESILEVIPRCMRFIRTEMRALASTDLTVPQFRVLVKLAKGEFTNKEVAEWLGVSHPTITRMIDVLISRNLVARVQATGDRREVRLTLTPKGRSEYQKLRANVRGQIISKISDLPSKKQETLQLGLKILAEIFP